LSVKGEKIGQGRDASIKALKENHKLQKRFRGNEKKKS
jgi:hypothetical protein